MTLSLSVPTLSCWTHLRSLDLDVAAGREGAGQLAGGAGSAHLVDGHVGRSLSLLSHHLHSTVRPGLEAGLSYLNGLLTSPGGPTHRDDPGGKSVAAGLD